MKITFELNYMSNIWQQNEKMKENIHLNHVSALVPNMVITLTATATKH